MNRRSHRETASSTREPARQGRLRVGTLAATLAAATLTLLFWQALVAREDAHFQKLVEAGARGIQGEVEFRLAMRGGTLAVLAREWEGRWFRSRSGWESDVRLVLSQAPGLYAVQWIKANGDVDWVYPQDADLPALDPQTLAAGAKASYPILAGPLVSAKGAPAFRILTPLRDSGQVEGWLAGTYAAPTLFGEILANLDSSFVVAVLTEGNHVLYQTDAGVSSAQQRWGERRKLQLPGTIPLVLRVEPSQAMIAAARSPLPNVLLAGGLLLSLLLGLALFLRSLAAARARALDREARAHRETAEEVRRLNLDLEERVRERTLELDRSNQELRQFASFLSHELRQPLSTQAVWANLLATGHADSLDEEGRRCVSAICAGARHMGELVESQLALATVHRSDFERVDMTSLVRDVVHDLKPELDAAGGSVDVEPLPAVLGDALQLRQLVRNLAQNAVKYRSPLRPLEVHFTGETGAAWVRIRICDNGRGFAPSQGERIFEAGVRLDASLAQGDGMGLALCRRVVAWHGGSITARGRVDEGTEITISLPRDSAARPEATLSSASR